MPTSIVKYTKASNEWTEIVMRFPDSTGAEDELHCTELCTIEGVTYVSVPHGVDLPDQPAEIKVETVTLTPELLKSIKAESPTFQLINERVGLRVRERYSADSELKMLRLDPCPEKDAYVEWSESCSAWGREQKAALGLVDFEQERARALKEVDRVHQQTILTLTGNPTEVERQSWPVKLSAAEAIANGQDLPAGAKMLLDAMGVTTDKARSEWAGKVLANSAKYQALIGTADKIRSVASSRIKTATPETWKAVTDQNRAEMQAAVQQILTLL